MKAVKAHRTQFSRTEGSEATPLNHPGFLGVIEARAVTFGSRIGVAYGEPFDLLKPLGLTDLTVFV
jgi:hypothetical protein